jgi:hypothetical protein
MKEMDIKGLALSLLTEAELVHPSPLSGPQNQLCKEKSMNEDSATS